MKVIKNNCSNNGNSDNKIHIECEYCGSELEITKADTHIGWLGAAFAKCPCCNQDSMVDEIDGIELTKDNIEFPRHFSRTNKDKKGVVEIKDWKIKEQITRGIEYLMTNKDESYWYTCFGDLFLVIFNDVEDREYYVLVTKDFYETYIPQGE